MTKINKRLDDLEGAVRPSGGDKIRLITVDWVQDDGIRSRREVMTKAEYYRRYPERRAAENDGQPIHVWMDWSRDEPE